MIQYKTPLRDIRFLIHEVFDFSTHYQKLDDAAEVTSDIIDAVLDEAAKFSEQVLSPLYQSGDRGCRFHDGEVATPHGFKETYRAYVDAGWQGLAAPTQFGGQGLPESLGVEVCWGPLYIQVTLRKCRGLLSAKVNDSVEATCECLG